MNCIVNNNHSENVGSRKKIFKEVKFNLINWFFPFQIRIVPSKLPVATRFSFGQPLIDDILSQWSFSGKWSNRSAKHKFSLAESIKFKKYSHDYLLDCKPLTNVTMLIHHEKLQLTNFLWLLSVQVVTHKKSIVHQRAIHWHR